jgi:hypothetical protein
MQVHCKNPGKERVYAQLANELYQLNKCAKSLVRVNALRKIAALAALLAFLVGPVVIQRHHHAVGPWSDADCPSCAAAHGTPPPSSPFSFAPELSVHVAPLQLGPGHEVIPLQIPPLFLSPSTSPPVIA